MHENGGGNSVRAESLRPPLGDDIDDRTNLSPPGIVGPVEPCAQREVSPEPSDEGDPRLGGPKMRQVGEAKFRRPSAAPKLPPIPKSAHPNDVGTD